MAGIEYNNAKKGVDISHQISSYYSCIRKTMKWYKKVFFEICRGSAVCYKCLVYSLQGSKKQNANAALSGSFYCWHGNKTK